MEVGIYPELLNTVFVTDAALKPMQGDRIRSGPLRVPSGYVVACDPFMEPDRPAFARRVSPGAYSVEAIQSQGRNAFVTLWLHDRLSCDPAMIRWEHAWTLTKSGVIDTGSANGYGVDSGFGCLMDRAAHAAMLERAKGFPEGGSIRDYWDLVLDTDIGDATVHDHYPLGPGSATNLIVVQSGEGGGTYATFWALNAAGTPVALVTDFGLIEPS